MYHYLHNFDASKRYKAAGSNAIDQRGTVDSTEFLNVAKDDALAFPTKVHRDYPETVNARMESAVKPFVLKSISICHTIEKVLNDQLGLPEGGLGELHRVEKISRCQLRCIKCPPVHGAPTDKPALSAHTDFGSLVRRCAARSKTALTGPTSLSFITASAGCRSCLPVKRCGITSRYAVTRSSGPHTLNTVSPSPDMLSATSAMHSLS